MVMKRFRHDGKRAERSEYGISAYVGANGGGKTAAMVWDALPDLEAGRPVLSTVRILDFENPRECDDPVCMETPERLGHLKFEPTAEGLLAEVRNQKRRFFEGDDAVMEPVETMVTGVHAAAHPLWIPWTTWPQLLAMNFGRVMADEMTGIAEARGAMTLPIRVINHLQQLRRADIPFSYTCPDWDRADVSIRQPTQVVTVCTGYMRAAAVTTDGGRQRKWRPRRLFKWQTYEAKRLTHLTEGHTSKKDVRAEIVDWHWGPGSPAWAAYDTFAPVLQVGQVTEGGRCHICGGSRPAPKCQGHHQDGSAPRPLEVAPAPARGRRRAAPALELA